MVHRLSIGEEIPRRAAADRVLGRRKRKNISVHYQQFPPCVCFNRRNLQATMANRTLFKMDQAEFEDKKLSRHKRKRCNVANLGGDNPLSADCLSQISAWIQAGDDGADKSYS